MTAEEQTGPQQQFQMKYKISRVFKKIFLVAASVFFLTFYSEQYSGSESLLEISEAENDPLDQNVKVSKLSEKKEILEPSTTGLVYTFKLPTKEDADSKSLVPKILHFMWIGSEVPGKYQENIIAWKEKNPTYQVGKHYRQQSVGTFLSGSLVDGQV